MKNTILLIALLAILFPMAKAQDNAGSMLPTRGTPVVVDASHPYTEDFEGTTGFDLINGDLENRWVVGSATNHGGSKALYISNDGGTSNAYNNESETIVYAAKTFSLSSGAYYISYDWKAYGEENYDFMRVVLVPADVILNAGINLPSGLWGDNIPTGWIALDGGSQLYGQTDWQNYFEEFTLSGNGTYNLVFIWRNDYVYGVNPPAAIDNISLTLATCRRPYDVAISNITVNRATVSWMPGDASQSEFVVAYGTGTNPAEMDSISVSDTTSIAIANLSLNTHYNVYVKAVCSTTEQSGWSSMASFSVVASPPYTEDFEGTQNFTLINGDRTNRWVVGSATNNGGSKALYISNDGGDNNTYNDGPEAVVYAAKTFSLSSGLYSISYDWKADGEVGFDYLRVALVPANVELNAGTDLPTGLSENSVPSGWIALDGGSQLCEQSDWQNYSEEFTISGNGTYNLVFVWRNDGSVSNDPPAAIDNISLTLATCRRPYDVAISNITVNSATVSWTPRDDSQSEFVVAYGTGTNPAEMDSISVSDTTSIAITNLSLNTHYNVYVKAVCSTTEQSGWSSMASFSVVASPPYTEDFEGTQNFTLINGDRTNRWVVGSVTNNGGSKALYISYDGGTSNDYINAFKTVVYAVKPFSLSSGTYYISYDWKANGEADYDYLRVALVPANVELNAGTDLPTGLSYNSVPSGWIALDGGSQLCGQSDWQTHSEEFSLSDSATYNLVFVWRNDESGRNYPPAAIDNINLILVTTNVAVPYNEDFDSYTTGISTNTSVPTDYPNNTLPNGWTFLNMSTSTSTYPQVFISSANDFIYSGNALVFRGSNSTYAYAVLPKFDTDLSELMLEFYYMNENAEIWAPQITVGYTTNPSDETAFVPLTTYVKKTTMTYAKVLFPSGLDNTCQIAFRVGGGAYWMFWASIDNIVVTAPSCFEPNVTIGDITQNSATVSWTPRDASQNDFVVAYGTGTDPAMMDSISVTGHNSVGLTGLALNTCYNVFVKALCSDTDQSEWNHVSFYTKCDGSVPYMEDFDRYTTGVAPNYETPPGYPDITLPNCWTIVNMSDNISAYPQVFISSYFEFCDSGYVLFFRASKDKDTYAVLPEFDIDLSELMLEFEYQTTASFDDVPEVTVGYTSDPTDETAFVPVTTLENTFTKTNAKVLFPTGLDDSYQIAFRVGGGSEDDNWTTLDNVSVVTVSPCTEPYANISDITSNSATVSWTPRNASQSKFVVAYGTGTNPAEMDSINVTGTYSVVLTSLASNTVYNVFVKAACSPSEMTDWTHLSFTTDCNAVPYNEDFDRYTWRISKSYIAPSGYPDITLPNCWTFLNMSSNSYTYPQAFISSIDDFSFSGSGNSLFFRGSKDTYVYAIMPQFDTNLSNLILEFYYRTDYFQTQSPQITVGYTSDPNDETAFVPVTELDKTETMTYAEVFFPTGLDDSCQIAFRVGGGSDDDYWASLDNISVVKATPIAEDFEGTSAFNLINGDLTNKWIVGTAAHNGGSQALYISDDGSSNTYNKDNACTVYAVSSVEQLLAGFYNIQYDWKANGEKDCDFLRVALVPADVTLTPSTSLPTGLSNSSVPSGWIPLDGGEQLTKSTWWQTHDEDFELSTAGSYKLVFMWRNDGSKGINPPIAVDNVILNKVKCPKPYDVTISSITESSAVVSWTSRDPNQCNFLVAYGTVTDPESMYKVPAAGSTSVSLANLNPGTVYHVFVKAARSQNVESDWSVVASFTTPIPLDYAHPFTEGFEGTTPSFAFSNGTSINVWHIGTAASNGGGHSMYVTCDGGTTNANHNTNTVVYATKLFNLTANTYSISYDWRADGEADYDYLRVALVPADVYLRASQNLPTDLSHNSLPSGWIALDGGSQLSKQTAWQPHQEEFTLPEDGTYQLAFIWRNDGTEGNNPPAAIDNVSLSQKANTFVQEGNWNASPNWSMNVVPTANATAVVQAAATIPRDAWPSLTTSTSNKEAPSPSKMEDSSSMIMMAYRLRF